jgi:ADP-heptose:LPS heptosyltransferase
LSKSQTIGKVFQTPKPEWNRKKEDLFVWKEQGIGDEIMFSSLLKEAEKQVSSLTVECDRRLLPIYKRSFQSNIKFIDDRKKINEQGFDSHLAIGSLLKHFRNDIGDFENSAVGWLKADQARVKSYRNALSSKSGSKLIGLSWFTKAKKANSHFRNIEVEQLSDHLHGLPFDFVSLQYGLSKKELAKINSNIQLDILSVNELDLFNDIDGLASLIAACDIVVSVDNTNVHLAGALGVDTRVILPKVADERWGLGEEESYLYDSIKIYRQTNSEDWSAPLLGLKKDLLDGLQ